MRAVNLIPKDARRGRAGGRLSGGPLTPNSLGPAPFIVGALLIIALVVLLRVSAENGVNDKRATLAAVQDQVATEQARASQYSTYTSFVQAAQAREQQVKEIAQQRFPWRRTLDQISELMPVSTSLSSLNATTAASPSTAASTSSAVTGPTGPSFTLSGCANTPNQNGVATLLRRLQHVRGVSSVSFQSSVRSATCGNQFTLDLGFGGASTPAASSASPSSTTAVSGTGVATTPSVTTSPAASSSATVTSPTTTGAATQ